MLITIDGPSGTGKSTTAKLLAQKLHFSFFDTGALYRSLAWWIKTLQMRQEDLLDALPKFPFRIEEMSEGKKYFVGEEDVTENIRSKEITTEASKIASIKEVRQALLPIQREYAKKHDSVFEGRDLGSVVFPEADVKIFLTARGDVRAKRRHLELLAKDPSSKVTWEEIFRAQQERDDWDSTREVAPLKCPEDAFVLDTSDLSMDQVIDILFQHIKTKGRTNNARVAD